MNIKPSTFFVEKEIEVCGNITGAPAESEVIRLLAILSDKDSKKEFLKLLEDKILSKLLKASPLKIAEYIKNKSDCLIEFYFPLEISGLSISFSLYKGEEDEIPILGLYKLKAEAINPTKVKLVLEYSFDSAWDALDSFSKEYSDKFYTELFELFISEIYNEKKIMELILELLSSSKYSINFIY